MKTRTIPLFLLTLLAACAGTAARQNIQLPALAGSWSRIKVQVLRADPSLLAEAEKADQALQIGDPQRLAAVSWTALLGAAHADIEKRLETGEIVAGVAESLRGRIADFSNGINLFLRKP